jgi:hypothetical protein
MVFNSFSLYYNTISYYYNEPLYAIPIAIGNIKVLNYLFTKKDRLLSKDDYID